MSYNINPIPGTIQDHYDKKLAECAYALEVKGSDPYVSLARVLEAAINQAAKGKGKERHAKANEPFDKQKICEITRRVGLGYPLGQAIKKAIEAQRLSAAAAQAEILGAINYLAAAYIVIGELDGNKD